MNYVTNKSVWIQDAGLEGAIQAVSISFETLVAIESSTEAVEDEPLTQRRRKRSRVEGPSFIVAELISPVVSSTYEVPHHRHMQILGYLSRLLRCRLRFP